MCKFGEFQIGHCIDRGHIIFIALPSKDVRLARILRRAFTGEMSVIAVVFGDDPMLLPHQIALEVWRPAHVPAYAARQITARCQTHGRIERRKRQRESTKPARKAQRHRQSGLHWRTASINHIRQNAQRQSNAIQAAPLHATHAFRICTQVIRRRKRHTLLQTSASRWPQCEPAILRGTELYIPQWLGTTVVLRQCNGLTAVHPTQHHSKMNETFQRKTACNLDECEFGRGDEQSFS